MQEDNHHRVSQMQTSGVTVTAAHLVEDTCVGEYDHITDQNHKHMMQYACLHQHEKKLTNCLNKQEINPKDQA